MRKKLFLFVLWVMAAFMPAVAQQTITVYDGTDNNSYVPIYGLYCDSYLKCEYVIPASELEDMTGATIINFPIFSWSILLLLMFITAAT